MQRSGCLVPGQGKGVRKEYLGREVSPLSDALIMQGDSFDTTKDDILGNLHP